MALDSQNWGWALAFVERTLGFQAEHWWVNNLEDSRVEPVRANNDLLHALVQPIVRDYDRRR